MTEPASTRADLRKKIVDAAAQLLHEHGPSAVTTRGVAEQAGVQAPTIYRLFGDKDGLLEAVAEHVMATFVSAKAAVVEAASAADVDPLEDLRAGWESQIEFGLANPALFRLLSDAGRALDSPAVASGKRVLEARVHRIAVAGRLRVSEPRAVGLIQAAGTGVVQTLLATPPDHRDPGLAKSMYEAVLRQILSIVPIGDGAPDRADVPDRAPAGSTATAVAFRAIAPELDVLTEAERRLLVEWLDRAIDTLTR